MVLEFVDQSCEKEYEIDPAIIYHKFRMWNRACTVCLRRHHFKGITSLSFLKIQHKHYSDKDEYLDISSTILSDLLPYPNARINQLIDQLFVQIVIPAYNQNNNISIVNENEEYWKLWASSQHLHNFNSLNYNIKTIYPRTLFQIDHATVRSQLTII